MNIKSTPSIHATQFSKRATHAGPDQLEIRFGYRATRRPNAPTGNRRTRARWWFDRMRQVVNQALDWSPAPAPRPEQIRMVLTSR